MENKIYFLHFQFIMEVDVDALDRMVKAYLDVFDSTSPSEQQLQLQHMHVRRHSY